MVEVEGVEKVEKEELEVEDEEPSVLGIKTLGVTDCCLVEDVADR